MRILGGGAGLEMLDGLCGVDVAAGNERDRGFVVVEGNLLGEKGCCGDGSGFGAWASW